MKAGREMFTMGRRRPPRAAVRPTQQPVRAMTDRAAMLESAQATALADPAFREHIAQGDQARDAGQWGKAENAYAAALSLHPYERSYWTQLGHMAKEQDRLVSAEIAYRTACALGAPPQDVVVHLRFVMSLQDIPQNRFSVHLWEPGPQSRHVPGRPDVLACAKLLWGTPGLSDLDLVELLRRCASLDALLAAMIRDPRFERFNRDWLELVKEDEL